MLLELVITCPHCTTAKVETMPTDACQVLYECAGCGAMLRPKQGDCCVFCSYGSVPRAILGRAFGRDQRTFLLWGIIWLTMPSELTRLAEQPAHQ